MFPDVLRKILRHLIEHDYHIKMCFVHLYTILHLISHLKKRMEEFTRISHGGIQGVTMLVLVTDDYHGSLTDNRAPEKLALKPK